MVTVTGFAERQRKDGNTFITLELTGGVELVQSQTNPRYLCPGVMQICYCLLIIKKILLINRVQKLFKRGETEKPNE